MTREITTAQTLPALVRARALRHPDRTALVVLGDGDNVTAQLDYRAVWQRAAGIAAAIADAATRGERAVILHGNDEHYLISFLGCLLAGVIAVPAFPPDGRRKQPFERLRGIVADARPRIALTSERLVPSVREALAAMELPVAIQVIASDTVAPAEGADAAARDRDIGFLQYTSGSTSAPRGVMVSHGNILANERAIQRAFGTDQNDVVVSWLPLYHDMGLIGSALHTLFLGAQLVLFSPEQFGAVPARWLRAIARHGGTTSGAPDFAYRMCLERVKPYQLDGLRLDTWELAFCGAEPIRAETLAAFADKFAPYGFRERNLFPCYGLAEATLLVTGAARGGGAVVERFASDALAAGHAVPASDGRALVSCGSAAVDHAVRVVDPQTGAELSPGRIGELIVEGPSVTAGYWGDPDAAAFAVRDGARALHTGDLGFIHRGQVFVAGRRKDMLIVRGQNLYPQDIERTIGEAIEVLRDGRVAAFAVDTAGGEAIGVAAELSKRMQKLVEPAALYRAISEAVAESHGDPPAVILLLDPSTLPMTSSGKLRRGECVRAWRDGRLTPYAVFERGAGSSAAPDGDDDDASGSLSALLAIARDVLGVAAMPGDSFYALGGGSLTGMQLAARLTSELGVATDPRDVLGAATLRALAQTLDERRARGEQTTAVAIAGAAGSAPADRTPLSAGEQRLWFLHQLDPSSTAYHLAGAMRVTGPLDVPRLARAFTQLVARHPVLRTQFAQRDGRPVRVIGEPWSLALTATTVAHDWDGELRRALDAAAAQPFDLERDRLLRARVLRKSDREHAVIVALHHLVCDGWSTDVLRKELAQLYADERAALPAQTTSAADYAVWQDTVARSDASQLAYWREILGTARPDPLPLPRSRTLSPADRGDGHYTFTLDAEATRALRELAQRNATTMFAVLLGGLHAVLYRYTGHTDLWIGTAIANRRPELAQLVGFFVNTVVLRTELAPERGFADHLARVKHTLAGALAHAELPYQHVLEATGAAREVDHQPLFQVFYNHLAPGFGSPLPLASDALVFGALERAATAAQFDLVLDTAETASGLTCELHYRADRIDAAAARRLAAHYAALLGACTADPSAPIERLPLQGADELRAARIEWNPSGDGELGTRRRIPVHEAIARRAVEAPNAIAIRRDEHMLSYAMLEARVARWTRRLRGYGVAPDTLVGLCAEPSFERVVGMLAILRAGGAVLPVDPTGDNAAAADAELTRVLRHAAPRVVLVSESQRARIVRCGYPVVSFADEPTLVELADLAANASNEPPPVRVRPDNIAFSVYAGDATRSLEASLVTHGALANLLDACLRAWPASAAERVLQVAPASSLRAACEVLVALVSGGACVVCDASGPEAVVDQLARARVTLAMLDTPLIAQLLAHDGGAAALGALRCLAITSDELPAALAAQLIALGRVEIWRLFGATDASTIATAARLTADDLDGVPPIGRPLANTTAHVLDGALNPVPAGGIGELYVGGAGLARGTARTDATAARWIPDPFGDAPGARLYRTGQRVRRRADGALEYVEPADRQRRQRQLAYWTAQLAGELPVLALPADRPPPATPSHRGALYALQLDEPVVTALASLARDHGSTPRHALRDALLAAFYALLYRVTGQTDLRVGMRHAETQVVRCQLDPRRSFAALVAETARAVTQAQRHGDLPFAELVAALAPAHTVSDHPLFQAMFEHHARAADDEPGLVPGLVPVRALCDLTLMTWDTQGAIDAAMIYAVDRFDAQTIAQLAEGWVQLARAIAAAPATAIGQLPILGDAERRAVLVEHAAGPHEPLAADCLHERIAAQCARTPDAVAVRHAGRATTYGELGEQARRLARRLRALGVGPDVLVGLSVERSPALVIGVLGILQAGGAYVPLDPDYPRERIAYMITDARPRVLVTEAALAERFADDTRAAGTVVCLIDLDLDLDRDRELAGDLPAAAGPANLVHCIYTSGSTGRPKGVALPHAAVLNLFSSMNGVLALQPSDRVLAITPISFDIAGIELLYPLTVGACVVIADRFEAMDPALLLARVRDEAVTLVQATPATWRMVVGDPTARATLARCRLITTGEALPPDLGEQLLAITGALANGYGPTETTIWSSMAQLDRERAAPHLGVALRNTTLYVLDAHLQPVGLGIPGELYIGGDGLARGYLRRPELTAERFIPDPFGVPGRRLYRTGDRVCRRRDGTLDYLGRVDHQVKLRGHRIELGEIEARLLADRRVRAAIVTLREDTPGKPRLVGYLVPRDLAADRAELRDELRAHLAAGLPDIMVPSQLVVLDALPLSPSGKIDRKALPAPDTTDARRAYHAYLAPRTPREAQLAAIWAEVLGVAVDEIGADDNFFVLGGDSIVAIQVVGKARAAGLAISPRDVFRHQTIAALAAVTTELVAEPAAPASERSARFPLAGLTEADFAALPVPLDNVEDIYPLTPMQDGMLLHTLLEPGSGIYVMQERYRVDSELDPAAFAAAWDYVIARHTALRASFWQRGDKTLQIISRSVAGCTEYIDLRGVAPADQERQIHDVLAGERSRGFDLASAPLMRLRLFQLADQAFLYAESHHHILMDDWCRSLRFLDFFAAYSALVDGGAPALPPAPQYGEHIAWLARQDRTRAHAHWKAQLAGLEAPTPLAIDRPLSADSGPSRVGYASLELPEHDTAELGRTARSLRLTPNTLAQGAWAIVLGCYAGARDVVFGTTVAGRHAEVAGAHEMIGLFVNSIPLRVVLPPLGSPTTLAAWLAELQDNNLGNRLYEHVPLVEIQGVTRVPRGEELFHSLFVYENAPLDPSLRVRSKDLRFRFERNRVHTNYPITVVLIPGERLQIALSYDERRFAHADIKRMLGQLARTITAIAHAPHRPVWQLSPLSRDEVATMTQTWNATARDWGLADRPLRGFAQRFAEQVAVHRDRIAVRCRGAELRYSELADRVYRIARALGERNAQVNDRIGIFAERGLDQLSLVVGVLAAGAVYVPLDIRHPAERIAHIARASGAAFVLTTAESRAALDDALAMIPPSERPRAITIDSLLADVRAPDSLDLASHPEQLAYVIYTSGSTGTPKGAMVALAGMLNNQLSKIPYLGLTERDVIAQTAQPSFDISVWQMLTGLLCGATVEIVPDDVIGDPRALLDHLRTTGVTVVELVPAMISELLREGGYERVEDDLTALRFLLPTGEALPPELARQWLRRYPHIPLVNAYGPAECADDVALCRIDTPPAADEVRMPIGRPTDNTQLFVLDPSLQPVPIGVTGQLAVAGIGVGHGYLADPRRTAETFVPHFGTHPLGRSGERMYLTGDLARYRPDGVLEYVGRADHQVKLRGHRIELGEIEAQLVAQPGVAAAAVILHRDPNDQARLLGYLAPSDTASDRAALRDRVRERLAAVLPAAMVPSQLIILDALPLSANGKLDRKALPLPDLADARTPYVAPRTELERALAQIWADALGVAVEKIGVHDNFFELGGHSLLITRVAARIRGELGAEIPLRALFDDQTVAAVAAVVEQARPRATAHELAVISDLLDELEQM